MHHRGVIPRIIIIIIVLRTLQTIVVRKCQSSRSHADQMLHLALCCCRDVDRPQRFTRWSNAIHSAVHTGSNGLYFNMCTSIYIQTMCLRGERDSSSIRRNAILNYALGRSHADSLHSFYIYVSIYIYMCPKTCIHKERVLVAT